ncbi:LysE family translocator [Neiella marina]|uniref:LysE family translocator n=1 Tax=Neiella holothuriorum TaxID=2870530 RepID=A0ABS7ECC2_9GAMM|nr:LysE family translocator [Neiella holothuriorum]MBW8189978.1 LysE family translocator [Neiella holothuriorum]
MEIELLMALSLFALVSSATPGPNNLMLLASGANFGFVRSIPHMLGVNIGFCLMVVIVGLGIMEVFEAVPLSFQLLQILSVLYLLYLAYQIATAQPASASSSASAKPMSFIQAVLFQWVNPKAWTMAVTAMTVYAPNQNLEAVLLVALVFGLVNFPTIGGWLMLGKQMQQILASPKWLRGFNVAMALLLVGSLYPMLMAN